jgi:leucyl-tRNA synthetase
MDPQNENNFCDRKVSDYWNQVDLYIGGTEHAVGHLLYSRMWTKALYDLGHIGFDEPFKRLVNQGMITGVSQFIHRYLISSGPVTDDIEDYLEPKHFPTLIISKSWADDIENSSLIFEKQKIINDTIEKIKSQLEAAYPNKKVSLQNTLGVGAIRVPIKYVNNNILDVEVYEKERNDNEKMIFISDDEGEIKCSSMVEKMSKSKGNVENPDDVITKYGADTFRMYEMFLGPVEMSKPWDTKGIEGVHRFLKKFWRLFYKETNPLPSGEGKGGAFIVTEEEPTAAELKVLHQTIKKIESDTERFSFNTAVSGFMIATNELGDLKCHKRKILEPLLVLLTPYAPHIAAELWSLLGNAGSVLDATYPQFEAKYVAETSKEYPISINGKLRTTMHIALDATEADVKALVLENEIVKKWLEGKDLKKFIFVKNKMVNVVI